MAESKAHGKANQLSSAINTYHCLCTSLLLATTTPLGTLPKRKSDKTSICQLSSPQGAGNARSHYALLLSTVPDRKPTVIRLEDGFEKRYLQRCGRCKVAVGYQLDLGQYEESKAELGRKEDVVYLLPGGLVVTEDMKNGKDMEKEIELVPATAA